MISVQIQGLDEVIRMVGEAGKQARYAAAVSLTKTAVEIKEKLTADMAGGFQSASPWSLKSQFMKPARRDDLVALVGIKDQKPSRGVAPATLLKEHFSGGARGSKPMEMALRAKKLLPAGHSVVPGAGMPLDAYGNPKKTAITELLGALHSGMAVYSKQRKVKGRGMESTRQSFFVVLPGASTHLAPGIWRRADRSDAKAVQAMFLFIPGASYRKRFDLEAIGRDKIRGFEATFAAEFQKAIATAK
jgi:hypothetical protein